MTTLSKSKQYNERQSKFMNLGDDVEGAHRHRYSEEKIAKRKADKARKEKLAALKNAFLASLTDDADLNKTNHRRYQVNILVAEWSFLGFIYASSFSDNDALIAFTRLHKRANDQVRKLYNKYCNNMWKARHCTTQEDFTELYQPKTLNRKAPKIGEMVGYVGQWQMPQGWNSTAEIDLQYFKEKSINLQFGKSVTDSEREFCITTTLSTLLTLESLNSNLDFRGYTFGFGARGMARSVAHFEPSTKVIQINRHRNGALIHEIGHAIDYKNRLMQNFPDSVFINYRAKIESMANIPREHKKYLLDPREVTARAIERVMSEYFTERGFSLDHNSYDWPDLTSEEILVIKGLIFKNEVTE
jgi:hypothetical protein